jgi:hypothetical protein
VHVSATPVTPLDSTAAALRWHMASLPPILPLLCCCCAWWFERLCVYTYAGYVGHITRVTTESCNDQGLTTSCLNVSVWFAVASVSVMLFC